MAQHFLPAMRIAGLHRAAPQKLRQQIRTLSNPRRLLMLCAVAMVLLAATVLGAVLFAVHSIDQTAVTAETARARTALAISVEAGGAIDADRVGRDFSFLAARLTEPGEVSDKEVTIAVPGRTDQVFAWLPRRFGSELFFSLAPMRLGASGVLLAGIGFVMWRLYRLTLELERQRRAEQDRAARDALTGLTNRLGFDEALKHAFETPHRATTLLYLDLDDFKQVNDTMGHGAGDELLRRVAERLKRFAKTDILVARIGGDEFGILVSGQLPSGALVELATDIATVIAEPVRVGATTLDIGVSIGIASAPENARDAVGLLAAADTALYLAKARDGGHAFAAPLSAAA